MSPKRHRPHVSGPTSAMAPFTFSAGTRVAFSDTDAQGIVYYGRYAPYFDVARVEFWRHLGFDPHASSTDFVMRAFEIEYQAPARFDDVLEVFMRVQRIGSSSVTFEFVVVLADGTDTPLARATQTLVNVDLAAHKPVPISDAVRARIEALESLARPLD